MMGRGGGSAILEDLDLVLVFGAFEEAVYVEAGEVDGFRGDVADFDDFFSFDDDGLCGSCWRFVSAAMLKYLVPAKNWTYEP